MTFAVVDALFKAVGTVAFVIAILQLREAKKKRMVEMYWTLADQYVSPAMQESRQVLNQILGEMPDFQEYLASKETQPDKRDEIIKRYKTEFHDARQSTKNREIAQKAQARIRFLNQAGVLVRKGLVDKDLLFGLIGSGLEIDYPILEVILESHRRAHSVPQMYDHLEYLWRTYNKWKG